MNLVPFAQGDVCLREACWIGGKPYFTRLGIGEWLGYPKPQKAIDKIVERHPHTRDPRWSVAVKLTATDGKQYDHEVYDPIGLQLILFESRQPKAIQYKIAVAGLVWAYMSGQLKPYKDPPPELAPALALPKWTTARRLAIWRIALDQGWTVGQVRSRIRRLESGMDPVGSRGPRPGRRWVQRRYRAVYPKAVELRQAGRRLREISAACGIPTSTVGSWTQRAGLSRAAGVPMWAREE